MPNTIAVVTGASSGIGRAIAIALAQNGVKVILLGRDDARLQETRRACPDASAVHTYCVDFSRAGALEKTARTIAWKYPSIDILIHSAGIIARSMIEDVTARDIEEIFSVNVNAPLLLTKILLPALKKTKGHVVYINSSIVGRIKPGMSLYAASKMALKAIADTLRSEVEPFGIRVTSVYPPSTATPMQEKIRRLESQSYDPTSFLTPADIAQRVIDALLSSNTSPQIDLHIAPKR